MKKALITGATSGIGEALARLFAKKKIPLLLTGRNEKQLLKLQQELQSDVSVDILAADLSDAIERQTVLDWMGTNHPDVVINNAGFGAYGEASSIGFETHEKMIEVNCTAVVALTLKALETFKNEEGIVVNVSSAAAYFACPHMAVYGATKAFVTSFSKALDEELKGSTVRILTAAPGMVSTHFSSFAAGRELISNQSAMSSTFAAQEIYEQIEKRKKVHLFDWKVRWGIFFARLFFLEPLFSSLIARELKKRIQ